MNGWKLIIVVILILATVAGSPNILALKPGKTSGLVSYTSHSPQRPVSEPPSAPTNIFTPVQPSDLSSTPTTLSIIPAPSAELLSPSPRSNVTSPFPSSPHASYKSNDLSLTSSFFGARLIWDDYWVNSNPNLMRAKNGTLICIFDVHDKKKTCGRIEGVTSIDDGETWSRRSIVIYEPRQGYAKTFHPIQLSDGRFLGVFHTNEYGSDDIKCLVSNDGFTWENKSRVYVAPDTQRQPDVIQLQNGDILVTFWDRGTIRFFGSSDGVTWTERSRKKIHDVYVRYPELCQFDDGTLMTFYFHSGAIYAFNSSDNGYTWSDRFTFLRRTGNIKSFNFIVLDDGSLYFVYRLELHEKRCIGESTLSNGLWKHGVLYDNPYGYETEPTPFRLTANNYVVVLRDSYNDIEHDIYLIDKSQ